MASKIRSKVVSRFILNFSNRTNVILYLSAVEQHLHQPFTYSQGTAPIWYDLFLPENPVATVVFIHGFKGFKDWGAWHKTAESFTQSGIAFLKFNFSGNGVNADKPLEFTDLEAFAKNTYSKEVKEANIVIGGAVEGSIHPKIKNLPIFVIGHSRGGGIALNVAHHRAVKGVITWASISKFNRWDVTTIENWQKEGRIFSKNVRTGQDMPLDFGLIEDYRSNRKVLRIKRNIKQLKKPILLIHGAKDEAVSWKEALKLKYWQPSSELIFIDEANHVFGATHPFAEQELPQALQKAVNESIARILN